MNLSRVPVNRLSTLARYGQLSKAQTIERAPEPRRTALLTAVEEAVPRTAVSSAVATVEALVPEVDASAEAAMREKLALRYNTVRPY
nr:hypothetical protein [Streptomyces asoensis]